jgi:acetolactate synthase I/II/III large subunit
MNTLSGGQIVAQTLHQLGAEVIFSVSGNQILSIYDAMADQGLRLIHMRHESAAAYAAAASVEVSNRPGVVLVSAGPAFVSALAGLAAARSMELPLLFLSGTGERADAGRGGFQDFDQRTAAGTMCKASMEVTAVEQIHSVLGHAWQLAQMGVPGPVHISLPVDVLLATATTRSDVSDRSVPLPPVVQANEDALRTMAQRLLEARRPLIIARPCAARGAAGDALRMVTQHLGIAPIVAECPRGLRDLKYSHLIAHLKRCDCALVIAPADFAVGFLTREMIASEGTLCLVDAPGDPQPRRIPDLYAQVPPELALAALADMLSGPTSIEDDWSRLWLPPPFPQTFSDPSSSDGLHPLQVAEQLRDMLTPDDIIVLDGGEFCQWIRMGFRDVPNRVVWNGKSGGIGGSIPMGVGIAAAGHPGRTFVILGDGAAGYHFSEFETAARYGMPVVVIIGNDGRWAVEWFLQASRYGLDRTFETSLLPVRYDQVASGLGAMGASVNEAVALRHALSASRRAPAPSCLNVRIRSVPSPAIPV